MDTILPESFFQLPIAPIINSRVRFLPLTLQKEKHLLPFEAKALFENWKEQGGVADGVILYGPGDPLASIGETLETVKLLKEITSDTVIALRTLGINGEKYADKLMQVGVSKVEVIMDGINGSTLERIYAWIRPEFKTLKLKDATEILLKEQAKAIPAFKDAGMHVQVITTCYPDNNSDNMTVISRTAAKLGADSMAIIPYQAVDGADIDLPKPDTAMMRKIETQVSKNITLGRAIPLCNPLNSQQNSEQTGAKPSRERPNVAVASSNGMEIDMHLGHASKILVYGPREDGLSCLLETRVAPPKGGGTQRWQELATLLDDCFVFLAASAGDSPKKVLTATGLPVQVCEGEITGYVDSFYSTQKKKGKGRSN